MVTPIRLVRYCCGAFLAMTACAIPIPPSPMLSPQAVVDVVHGLRIADPYRVLENGDAPETRAFTDAHNARTHAVLDKLPARAALKRRISALLRIGTIGTPSSRRRKDGTVRYFYSRRTAEQNQVMLYVRDGLRGADRLLVDPTKFAKDGTAALDWYYPSPDGSKVAYGVSEGGSERSVLRVRDVDSGRDLPDVIERTRACSLEWLPDGSGFYYTRYAAKGTVPDDELGYHRRVYFHALGADPERDAHVFGQGRDMKDWPSVDLSPDGRWLVVTMSQGFSKTEVYLKDRSLADAPWVALAEGIPAIFYTVALNDRVLVMTNHEAPRYRLYAVDPSAPSRQTPLLNEGPDVLATFLVVGDTLFANYLRDAHSVLRRHELRTGAFRSDVKVPVLGSLSSLSGRWDGDEAFVALTSFTMPTAIYRLELKSGAATLWERVEAPVDEAAFEVKQVRYPSRDGTQVTMFLVHKKGLRLDGSHPTYLYGYGGFNVSYTPAFLGSSLAFVERGGVYALPNLRGGGEYGEAWHKAGMRDKKQNTFDDFIAAAEWLIKARYTTAGRLAIAGGSNGGLLVGAALTQRPELFRAVVCMVPLLDMTRYHKFLIAKLWTSEYGSPDVAEEMKWLYAYSPYHRVKDGTAYPSVLLMAGESDTRVDPLHARKMAARLQAATASGDARPILLRIETRAGHGQGKPVNKQIVELVERWSYVFWQLGIK